MKIIETSKVKLFVTNNLLDAHKLWGANEYVGVISEITEEEAGSIVDYPIILEEIKGGGKMYTYYNYKISRYDYGSSLVESLKSLLESQGIEITKNTYIFKV